MQYLGATALDCICDATHSKLSRCVGGFEKCRSPTPPAVCSVGINSSVGGAILKLEPPLFRVYLTMNNLSLYQQEIKEPKYFVKAGKGQEQFHSSSRDQINDQVRRCIQRNRKLNSCDLTIQKVCQNKHDLEENSSAVGRRDLLERSFHQTRII